MIYIDLSEPCGRGSLSDGSVRMLKILICLGIGVFIAVVLAGCLWANWPQWRGPESNRTAPKAQKLPVTWPDSLNILWRIELPSWSAATPAVWQD